MEIIIVAPSLDTTQNVSGVSAVANFIIANNPKHHYVHFMQGKTDNEKGGWHRIVRVMANLLRWQSFLKKHKDAVIHYNFPLDALSILRDTPFMQLAIWEKMPMVVHVHGGLYLFKTNRPKLINAVLKHTFNWQSQYIVLSNKEKAVLERNFKAQNVKVLPNCIDLTEQKNFERNNYDEPTLHILYLGRIEPNKGVDYMLAAAEQLRKDKVNFILHFAGKDQYKDYYVPLFQECLHENFVYEGIVSGRAKTELLQQCHVFWLPSFYEGLPMSLLECMSFGMVPIVTNVGSIGEYVKDEEDGLIVPIKNTDDLVKKSMDLYRNRDKLKRLSKTAQKCIGENFDPQRYIDSLNQIYSEVKLTSRCF